MLITTTQLQASIVPFLTLMSPNARLHAAIEMTVQKVEFGEITFTVTIKDGVADLKTFSPVVRKRYKY
jgi:hypothetical protein